MSKMKELIEQMKTVIKDLQDNGSGDDLGYDCYGCCGICKEYDSFISCVEYFIKQLEDNLEDIS